MEGHKVKNNFVLRAVIENLFASCEYHGTDASGMAFTSYENVIVIKDKVNAKKFISSEYFTSTLRDYGSISQIEKNIHLKSIIGHCRTETQGSHAHNKNNHPFTTDRFVGIHNGHISNYLSIKDSYDLKYTGDCDSESIFRLIDHYSNTNGIFETQAAIIETAGVLIGSYACAMIDSYNPHMLWLFRNTNPIYIYVYDKVGVVIFSTSDKYITKATISSGFGVHKEIKIETSSGIGIDLFNNRFTKFDLDLSNYESFMNYPTDME